MPLDAAVPKYKQIATVASLANMKPIADGMFRASVPTTIQVTAREGDSDPLEYTVVLKVDVIDGRMVCTSCEVRSDQPGHSVTADALRRVPVGRYLREAMEATLLVMEVDPGDGRVTRPFVWPPPDFAEGGLSDQVLSEVARIYHWAMATADAPLGLLERQYGIPRGKASRWIATARRRGFIKDGGSNGG